MTKEELKIAVDEYFVEHLDHDYWTALPDGTRNAGITMAVTLIQSLIDFDLEDLTVSDHLTVAIAEQAVYIVRNHEEFQEGKVVTSDSVEGISNSYALINGDVTISRIAQRYIDRAKRAGLMRFRRFTRG